MEMSTREEVDLYNYKQALAALIKHNVHILTTSPCSLKDIVNYIISEGDGTSVNALEKGLILVNKAHPHVVIFENEECLGFYFMFMYLAPLQEIANLVFSKDMDLRNDIIVQPIILQQPKVMTAARGKKKKAKKPKQIQIEVAEANDEPHVISNNIDSLKELANDILGKQSTQLSNNISWVVKMLQEPTALEQEVINQTVEKLAPFTSITEICDSNSWAKCLETRKGKCSNKIHFEEVIESHTDVSLGDCAYLDSCFKGKMCRYVHYSIRFPRAPPASVIPQQPLVTGPQSLNADILKLDLKLLGTDFKAMIIDPPWEIHTNPGNVNGCSDNRIANLEIGRLQESGVVFLWVTGRVLEFGRKCLEKWGYTHIEEMIWLKTNQLCRTICTGRTGHWLNHTKEHVLVGVKGEDATLGLQLDTDVIVSHALGRSQKPVELYSIIDRLVGPYAKKLELFGRASNRRDGWLTVGNEMHYTKILDPELKMRLGL